MDYLVRKIYEIAGETPEKEAVIFKKETLSYKDLCFKMEAVASFLDEQNIKKGSAVCFSAVSKPEMVYTYLGILRYGCVAVFLDKNATPQSVSHIYNKTKASILISDKNYGEYESDMHHIPYKNSFDAFEKDELQMGYELPKEDELCEMLFTTGTTAEPKGVMHTYASIFAILQNTILGVGVKEDERVLIPLPLNHSFALRVLRAVLYQGATLVLQNGFTFAKNSEENILNHHCTAMACVPASYEVMKSQMKDEFPKVMSHLRYIEFGAGSLNIKQRKEITALLPQVEIFNTWGSSETGGVIFGRVSRMVTDEKKIGALGMVSEKAEIRVKNDRMCLSGPMLMEGYFENEALTKETIFYEDGKKWLMTGDSVIVEDDGTVFMLGRADDILNVGGEKVSPVEIAEVATMYEGIKECTAVGEEDEILGQHPVLFVVPGDSYKEEELVKFLSQKLERYKLPARYIRLSQLPRNAMSKIDKKKLVTLLDQKEEIPESQGDLSLILNRRSIRHFKNQSVEKEKLEKILQAAIQAPTGRNMQSWQFFVLSKQEDIQGLKEATTVAAKEAKVKMYGFDNPSAMILVTNDIRNKTGCQDASCSAQNILLAANALGLGSCWLNPLLTLRDTQPVSELLDSYGVPKNHVVYAAIALGYPDEEGKIIQRNPSVIHFI
ncbi:MAG: AMP-binding protein [Lachnospiraceae bacterium]|nr:AMP-binding protein [Lachnospiraceae bacterium]